MSVSVNAMGCLLCYRVLIFTQSKQNTHLWFFLSAVLQLAVCVWARVFRTPAAPRRFMFGFCPSTTQLIHIIKAWWFLSQLCSARAKLGPEDRVGETLAYQNLLEGKGTHCCHQWPVSTSSPCVLRNGRTSNTDLYHRWPGWLNDRDFKDYCEIKVSCIDIPLIVYIAVFERNAVSVVHWNSQHCGPFL